MRLYRLEARVMHARAAELIATLELQPHPEGGYYRELFRSAAKVTPADRRGDRAALTTIYFLLTAGTQSRWHQVRSDEVWHLYEGGPLELLELSAACDALSCRLLTKLSEGGEPVHTVAAGKWQAARPTGDYVLAGCTVGPGFDFADFRMLSDQPELAEAVRARWTDMAALI